MVVPNNDTLFYKLSQWIPIKTRPLNPAHTTQPTTPKSGGSGILLRGGVELIVSRQRRRRRAERNDGLMGSDGR